MMAETFVRQPLFAFRLLRRQETWYNERKVSERMRTGSIPIEKLI